MHDVLDSLVESHLDNEDHPLWATDRIALTSAGIDIGSTTSHMVISKMELRKQGRALSSRFQITGKKIIYESNVLLTPFIDGTVIDDEELSEFINNAYLEANIRQEDIDSGAVILTGEAARKDNAETIAGLFSEQAGKFVCATAGPNLEARMAAYGSGVVQKSVREDYRGTTLMNVDIGGGTSKIAVIQNGRILETAVINVGARLIAFGHSGRLVRIEDAANGIAKAVRCQLSLGMSVSDEEKRELAEVLAVCLLEVVNRRRLSPLSQSLLLTPPLNFTDRVDALFFSGGVSEYIYGYEKNNYGDLGELLAGEIRRKVMASGFNVPVGETEQRIRATVIGAAQYTMQVSGSTIFLSGENALPIRSIQVVKLHIDKEVSGDLIGDTIRHALEKNDLIHSEKSFALAFRWDLDPSNRLITALAKGISASLNDITDRGLPVIIVFDADIAKLVGNKLKREFGLEGPLVSIDGIELQDFDFIDIGEQLPESKVVPVVIKSLVFRPDAQADVSFIQDDNGIRKPV